MNKTTLWKTVLAQLQVDLSPAIFKTWFVQTKLLGLKDGIAEIGCPSYAKNRLEERYYAQIKKVLDGLTKQKNELVFKVDTSIKVDKNKDLGPLFIPENQKTREPERQSGLFPQYTFANFIVGSNNNLAHAVASAIAEKPGKVYNPFFLHSRVGLGKTHLIQAIGNRIRKRSPRLKVIYCTGESFANELIDAIRSGDRSRSGKFRKKFRGADVWLIDDVQFIAGREATQEEFFHTFNALYLSQKQIVLTSDRPPREISKLEERLSSRFQGGMIADMQLPDLDVRAAILRLKRDQAKLDVPNEAIDFVAGAITSNIRDLEGAFLQIVTTAQGRGEEITLELAREILGQNRLAQEKKVTSRRIIEEVCTYYALKPRDLRGPRRPKNLALARQVAMYLMRTLGKMPLAEIGEVLGGRDHTTVMHGVEKIENLLPGNKQLGEQIRVIESQF